MKNVLPTLKPHLFTLRGSKEVGADLMLYHVGTMYPSEGNSGQIDKSGKKPKQSNCCTMAVQYIKQSNLHVGMRFYYVYQAHCYTVKDL